MKIAFIAAWVLFAIEVLWVAMMFIWKDAGNDAAGRGVATGFGTVLLPFILIAGALLYWGQNSPSKALQWTALIVVAVPFLIGGGLWASNTVENISHRISAGGAGRFSDPHLTNIARAIERKDYPAVEALLKQPAKIDWEARDALDATLLGYAVNRVLADYSGDPSVEGVRLLLARGARSSEILLETIISGNTPGSVNLLQAVLEAGANPNSPGPDGLPLIHITHAWHGLDKLKLLARHGADLQALNNRPDRPQWTALMNAAYMMDWEMALFFLQHGVPPGYVAPDGNTLASILKERASNREAPSAAYDEFMAALRARTPAP